MKKQNKKDGYSRLAANQKYHFDKEKFVQAGMKFILKNPVQDGGCLIKRIGPGNEDADDNEEIHETEDGANRYMANFFSANETVNWRDVV